MLTVALNDALALYVQLDPADVASCTAGLQSLREMLWALMLDPGTPPAAQRALAAAVACIDGPKALAPKRLAATYSALQPLLEAVPCAAGDDASAGDATRDTSAAVDACGTARIAFAGADTDDLEATLTLAPDVDTSIMSEFVTESRESLEQAEAALLHLENSPDDAEAINTVFRAFHTIKGSSSFLQLQPVSEFAHHAETLLTRIRSREIPCSGGFASLALRSVDILGGLLDGVQKLLGGEPAELPRDYHDLLATLVDPEAAGISGDAGAGGMRDPLRDRVEPDSATSSASRAGQDARGARGAESMVRVRTDRLDKLIEMIGELVIAEAMVAQDVTGLAAGHHSLARNVAQAGKIVRELQDLSMGMRMVPLKAVFQKVARLARDLAQRSGKLVEFHAEGEDTEIDRNLVDLIADPLVHMVRNAVDHGIEPPAEREAAGKRPGGTIRLSAYHAGGNVVVELDDDGRGLSRDRILRKAIAQGLVDPAQAETMSAVEVYNLIFAPGFSTAERVTEVSGRGVGMDVVRRNVESVRGRCEIGSRPGDGTTFTLRLPLTLAITDGMLVGVGAERYIVPTVAIVQTIRPAPGSLSAYQGRGEMVRHRDTLYPVLRLHEVFDVPGAQEDPERALLVIVGEGSGHTAILVDDLIGQHQVVAKSLGDTIGRVRGVAGGAILGDGHVGLIIDVAELVAMAQERGDVPAQARSVA